MKKSSKKVPINYSCDVCDYITSRKSQWNRHILTAKHAKLTNAASGLTQKVPCKFICKKCKIEFNHRQSLFRHKKTCICVFNESPKVSKSLQKVSNEYFCECGKKYKSKSGFYKHKLICNHLHNEGDNNTIISDVIHTNVVDNNEVATILKSILEENKELRKEIKNLKIANITNNNTQNNQFNINMFLNEKCKNAMNLEDFIEKIKLSKSLLSEFKKVNIRIQKSY